MTQTLAIYANLAQHNQTGWTGPENVRIVKKADKKGSY